MVEKYELQAWIRDALISLGGSGSPTDVARAIWESHETDLRDSGDLFFTWQYDMRWAAQRLRDSGVLVPVDGDRRSTWRLAHSDEAQFPRREQQLAARLRQLPWLTPDLDVPGQDVGDVVIEEKASILGGV